MKTQNDEKTIGTFIKELDTIKLVFCTSSMTSFVQESIQSLQEIDVFWLPNLPLEVPSK